VQHQHTLQGAAVPRSTQCHSAHGVGTYLMCFVSACTSSHPRVAVSRASQVGDAYLANCPCNTHVCCSVLLFLHAPAAVQRAWAPGRQFSKAWHQAHLAGYIHSSQHSHLVIFCLCACACSRPSCVAASRASQGSAACLATAGHTMPHITHTVVLLSPHAPAAIHCAWARAGHPRGAPHHTLQGTAMPHCTLCACALAGHRCVCIGRASKRFRVRRVSF
jgi:hypothetical protein